MLAETIAAALLASVAIARPVENPIHVISAGPSPGVVINKCSQPGMLALAYDDGPHTYTKQLVDTLDKAGVKGTFFWTGTLYGCVYSQAAAIKAAFASGHQVASHTWTHGHMGGMSTSQITTEMTRVEQALVNIIGVKPRYMRPPYLETSGQFLPTLKSMGYVVITDDIDTGDWNNNTPQQSEQKFTSAGASGNGHIPLMHEVYQGTVQTLTPWLINWAKTNNLKIVTVAECLGDAGHEYQVGNFTANGQSSC